MREFLTENEIFLSLAILVVNLQYKKLGGLCFVSVLILGTKIRRVTRAKLLTSVMTSLSFFIGLVLMVITVSHVLEATYVSVTPSPPTCATLDCLPNQTCKMYNKVPKCVNIMGCNTACTFEFDPVCGSDGITYSNACELKVAACKAKKTITVASFGACPVGCEAVTCLLPKVCKEIDGRGTCVCSSACPKILRPVCGSDGVTYNNECLLKVKACKTNTKITVASQGRCPVGCEAVTCLLPKVCKEIDGRGTCVCSTACPRILRPVCGSDGVTYNNECLLKVKACKTNTKITVASQGRCPAGCEVIKCGSPKVCVEVNGVGKCVCPTICPAVFQPVCGSDGKTYSNQCTLGIAACNSNKIITVVSQGPCPQPTTATTTTTTSAPKCDPIICAWPNICKFVNGQSKCICSKFCTLEFAPVCGSDGKTYPNRCSLQVAACTSNTRIKVVSQGSCPPKLTCANVLCTINTVCKMINGKPVCLSCPKACAEIYKPVCGSDKVTYSNKCEMERAGCKKGIVLTVAHNRPCGKVCFNFKCHSPPYSKCESVNGRPKCVCKFFCDKKQDLVCGSDRKTYDNICIMKQTACETNKKITVASKRLCNNPCFQSRPCRSPPYSFCRPVNGRAKCVCNEACPMIYSPVCGSDGKTYSNECQLKASSCRRNKKVTVRSIGKCINPCMIRKCTNYATCEVQYGKAVCVCPKACTKIYRPVCGTDGRTYANKCRMRVDSCKRGKKKITVEYEGKCRVTPVPVY